MNEAYLRLVDAKSVGWDRVHFFAISAQMMRRILVDAAGTGLSKSRLTPIQVDGFSPNQSGHRDRLVLLAVCLQKQRRVRSAQVGNLRQRLGRGRKALGA